MAHTAEPQTRNPSAAGRLANCRRLGLAGSLALLVGGIFAGIPPKSEPLLQHPDLLQLRAFITPTVALVYGGLSLLVIAWWRLGRLVRSPDKPTQRELIITFAWWGVPLLVNIPVFSTDVYSYIAQGTMTVVGVDAYHQGPRILSGQWAVDIPDIWHTTPAPYGPVFLSLAAAVSLLTGGSVWLGVLGMRLLALVGIALVIAAIPRLSRLAGVDPAYGLWLGVLNPVVLVHLVGDAHNDAIMIGLMMAGLTLAVERRPAAGAMLVTLGALVKAPAGLALAFIVGLWASRLEGRARYVRAALAVGAVAGTTVVVTTWLAGTGYGWVAALGTPTLARTWTSITTDLGYLTGFALEQIGLGTRDHALAFWQYTGLAVAATICGLMLLRHRTNPVLGVGLGLGAVVSLAPVFHPWYMLWATVPLGAAATSPRTRKVVVGLTLVMTLLVFPGGIPPGVPAVAGLLIGCLVVLGTAWAMANLDRANLAKSARSALYGLTPAQLIRRLRDEWREPNDDPPASTQPVGLR